MLAKNRSLNEIYYKLLLNSPQMITMDIPLKIGKGNISQTKIKHGVILADWKMCYESDMNVQGPVSNEYIQIIFCLNDGISSVSYTHLDVYKRQDSFYVDRTILEKDFAVSVLPIPPIPYRSTDFPDKTMVVHNSFSSIVLST